MTLLSRCQFRFDESGAPSRLIGAMVDMTELRVAEDRRRDIEALYGLFLVLVVSAGRANVTTRNFPAALAGLVVNVVLLLVLVGPLGIAGAGIALCGAYLVMLAVMYALTREVFPVPFQWARLAHLVAVIGGVSVAGELLLPTAGAAGLLTRCAALAALPVLLAATGFLRPEERVRLAELWARARRRGAPERPEPRPQALP